MLFKPGVPAVCITLSLGEGRVRRLFVFVLKLPYFF